MGEEHVDEDPLSTAAAGGFIRLRRFDDDFGAGREVSDRPLDIDGFGSIVERAKAAVKEDGLLIADHVIEEAVLGLITGHVVLEGPPGTGKTSLVRALCAAFNVGAPSIETATADWSTYDVIGGHETARTPDGAETIRPRLGIVPRAALACAEAVAANESDSTRPQAHWLLIDEMNRCELDKCFGPLFTVLGNDAMQSFQLWFEDDPKRLLLWIPRRFRIIGTLNSIDKQFVFAISQGLTRRFQFVHVGVPEPTKRDEEKAAVYDQARRWYERTMASAAPESADAQVFNAMDLLMDFADEVRYRDLEWPLGTAQLVDVVKRLLVCRAANSPDLIADLDAGIAARIVPAMDQLPHDAVQGFLGDFAAGEAFAALDRTRRQIEFLQRLSASF